MRRSLKKDYGFHIKQEMHTKLFLTDKGFYRNYNWTPAQKREILLKFIDAISNIDVTIINVIIDKENIKSSNYPILDTALRYNIQRINNDIGKNWNYLIITDSGRVAPMRKTARAIQVYNPIASQFSDSNYRNLPIQNLIEDILDKDSRESLFIQLCDFVSYFVHLYYKIKYKKENLPNRVGRLIDSQFVFDFMNSLDNANKFNTKASGNPYGLVIYPRK